MYLNLLVAVVAVELERLVAVSVVVCVAAVGVAFVGEPSHPRRCRQGTACDRSDPHGYTYTTKVTRYNGVCKHDTTQRRLPKIPQ